MLDKTAKETKPKKKIVAREYLILLLCLASGIAPALILRDIDKLIFVPVPYLIVSFIRSIMWALRTFFYK